MYIKMTDTLTFQPTFTKMTILVEKTWLLITVNFVANVAVNKSDIKKFCTGAPNFVFFLFNRNK